jgi:hypothetical protein
VLERVLDSGALEGLFSGPDGARYEMRLVIAGVATNADATRRAVAAVASARGVTPAFVVDRVMVIVACLAVLRRDDPYVVLGLSPGASAETVRRRWRTMAKAVHPDVATDRGAAAEFARLRRAFDVLGDPDRRVRYDADLLQTGRLLMRELAASFPFAPVK